MDFMVMGSYAHYDILGLGNVYTYFMGICAVGVGIASFVLFYRKKREA